MPSWINPLIALLATALGGFFAHRFTSPKDLERASLLSKIAAGAAAFMVGLYPNKAWAELLQLVIGQIAAAAGLPTKNAAAIERAAADALAQLGKLPDAGK